MTNAISMSALNRMRFKTMDFSDKWVATLGKQQDSGSWIVWGESGNGKTSMAMQMAVEMAHLGYKVWYNSLEQGASLSMRETMRRHGAGDVSRRLYLLDKESYDDLMARLDRRNPAQVIVIDSLQYLGITIDQYKEMTTKHRNKLFIWVSHADGKQPAGATASFVRYDANVKISVIGYKAYATGRDVGNKPYTVWEMGANAYHGNV